MAWSILMYVMLLEWVFFVFVIIIFFDIRDLDIDVFNKVKILLVVFGVCSSQWLGGLSLGLMFLLVVFNYYWDVYIFNDLVVIVVFVCLFGLLIFFFDCICYDYFFIGLVDGMMVLQFLFVVLL